MKHLSILSVFSVIILVGAIPVAAHHSSTMFDQSRTVTFQGVVTKWELTNPHSWLHVEVIDKNGKKVVWGFEAEGPSTLQRSGIKPSDLKVGTKVTITGNPMRDGTPAAIWVNAVREDGKKLDPRAGFAVK